VETVQHTERFFRQNPNSKINSSTNVIVDGHEKKTNLLSNYVLRAGYQANKSTLKEEGGKTEAKSRARRRWEDGVSRQPKEMESPGYIIVAQSVCVARRSQGRKSEKEKTRGQCHPGGYYHREGKKGVL